MHRMVLVAAMAAILAASGCDDKSAPTTPTMTTFSVTVDYSRSLAEMIAAGRYDRVDFYITEANFPISGNGKVEVKLELVHFNRAMNTNDVFIELNELGLRPATLTELLAFGAAYPVEQRKYPIIAFGSVWQDWYDRRVPYLWLDSGGRLLVLGWFENNWGVGYRFLAVREPR